MSASRVFQMEGGQEPDIEPTRRLLRKKLAMGYPHVIMNNDAERLDFLCVRREHQETFARCWEAYQTGVLSATTPPERAAAIQEVGETVPEGPRGSTDPPAAGPPAKPKGAAKNSAKKAPKEQDATGGGEPRSTADPPAAGPKPSSRPTKRQKQDTPQSAAAGFITSYNKSKQEAAELLEWITSGDPRWDWANSEKTLKPIQSTLELLSSQAKQLSPNQRLVLVGGHVEMADEAKPLDGGFLAKPWGLMREGGGPAKCT